jgi:succinate-semialdehyde dehydrogenase/glutarate-semialdehyde dehydrogenase
MTLPERLDAKLFSDLLARIALRPDAASPETAPLIAPFTGEKIIDVPTCALADVTHAAEEAHLAQKAWRALPAKRRAKLFLRFHDLVLDRQETLLDLIQLETGKARRHAFEEVLDTAICSRYYAHAAPRMLASESRQGAFPVLTKASVLHPPLGLVGFITPWNYPLSLAITDAIPALIAGNAVLLKPDQQTPLTALFAARLLDEAGLPPGLFQVLTGPGRTLGEPILDRVDAISFTGSTATGRIIARQAGERLIGASLELGGKNAMLVCEDADLDRAVRAAIVGAFTNSGQLCISIERLFVHRALADAFIERFVNQVRALRIDAGFGDEADMGSLVNAAQLAKVERHVRDALAKGAQALAGGRARPDLGPYFYEPTVLDGVTDAMEIFSEETFGPVVSLYRFDSEAEAVERANASAYGLNASVWTRDTKRGFELARRIEAGTVNVNEPYAAAWASVDAPMGGFKTSGLGRRHGREGLLKYTQAQTVAVQRFMPVSQTPGGDGAAYRKRMTDAVRALRRLPGVD